MDILKRYDAWVFDMDGTLTLPQHDFSEVRRRLGFGPDVPLLEEIDANPPAERERLMRIVSDWEWESAELSIVAPGAKELLQELRERRIPYGILTRNRRDIALFTLRCIGLDGLFNGHEVLGRDEAEPKPAPDGVVHLLNLWERPARAVMVGAYIHDLQAGHSAGCETILVGPKCPPEWRPWVNWWGSTLAVDKQLVPIE